MAQKDSEVKISRNGKTRTISMRHPPKPGEYLTVKGKPWLVVSVSYTVPYRIPSMSFIVKKSEAG